MTSDPLMLEESLRQAAPQVLETMNTDFDDSLLLVGRVLGRRPSAIAARAVGLDARGIDLLVVDGDGEHRARVDFATPVSDVHEVATEAMALVVRARQQSGEQGE